MGKTFGGNTTDDLNVSIPVNVPIDGGAFLVCGWWYPTTLTAGRTLWSFGNVTSAEIDSTTSELKINIDATGTDGAWLTSGLGLVTDEWQFLAFLGTYKNSGMTAEFRVWRGTVNERPQVQTPSVSVSPTTGWNGQATAYLGNKGTGSLAFQGDIGTTLIVGQTAVTSQSVLQINAAGTITNDDEAWIYRQWVEPFYLGRLNLDSVKLGIVSLQVLCTHDATTPRGIGRMIATSTPTEHPITLNGSVQSELRTPITFRPDALISPDIAYLADTL